MSTNKKIKKRQNDFDQLLRKKLENHHTPVSPNVWDKLETAIPKQTKTSKLIPWYYISGAAVAVIAVVLLIHPFQTSNDRFDTPTVKEELAEATNKIKQTKSQIANLQETGKEINLSEKNEKTFAKQALINSHFNEQKRNVFVQNSLSNDIKTEEKSDIEKKEKALNENNFVSQQDSKQEEIIKKEETEKKTDNDSKKSNNTIITDLPDLNDYPVFEQTTVTKQRKYKPILTAYAGSSNNIGKSNSTELLAQNSNTTQPRFMVNRALEEKHPLAILRPEDYSDVQHQAPLSFGVRVELPLNKRIGIESGLNYTYLKSNFSRLGAVTYSGTLQLHYLGIPLNVRAKILTGKNWNIYASAGGMVEKGLRSHYHQSMETQLSTKNTDVSASIDGFQWSLNGSLGVDVVLNNTMSLFVEPDLTYYLENNQPMSARTEQPLNFGVNGGLRFKL